MPALELTFMRRIAQHYRHVLLDGLDGVADDAQKQSELLVFLRWCVGRLTSSENEEAKSEAPLLK